MTAQVLLSLRVPGYLTEFPAEVVSEADLDILAESRVGGLHPSTQAPAPVTVQVADKGL